MPIYNYQCRECGKTEEYLLKMGDSPSKCAYCPSSDLSRVRDGETFSAKGSGSARLSGDISDRVIGGISISLGVISVGAPLHNPRNN